MPRALRILSLFVLSFIALNTVFAQQRQTIQLAGLRPVPGLYWQRISPTPQQPDGPVLYQLLLNASGTPGTVPVFDTNPRHLVNSPITVNGANVMIGGGSALNINGSSGIITFAPGQTFPASGLPNLAGEVSGAPNATVVSNAVAANTANAIMRRDGSGNFTAGTAVLSNLALSGTSSSSVGVISFGGVPFVHDFGTANTFVGLHAGNFTTSGGFNTAIGASSFEQNTTGSDDTAVGTDALFLNTSGSRNSAFGDALVQNTTGGDNAAFGYLALYENTTASGNSAFGASAMLNNTTGYGNAAFGFNALNANTTAGGNSAFGWSALQANTLGASNSAFGYSALNANTTGFENSAFGNSALVANTGNSNSAFGSAALFVNTTGGANSAFGANALILNSTGIDNSAFGFNALSRSKSGLFNTALGDAALSSLGSNGGTGDDNIAVGWTAGSNLQNGSNNIYISNGGSATESNTIRIGVPGVQTAAFITGIYGATNASGTSVFVDSFGQLGTSTSSRRYKQDIVDLGAESDVLMKLRPVAFYYKPELDETHTRQYGLVAEEVAQIAPNLVIFDEQGKPQTVRYHFVNAMLLNEVQKQRRLIEAQRQELAAQQQQMERQQKQNEAQQQHVEALEWRLGEMMTRLEAVEASSRPQARTSQIAAAR